jgi:ATP-dependent DNA ligase
MPIRTLAPEKIGPPAWIKPELAMLVKAAPEGMEWLHEIKLDGYRMHTRLEGGTGPGHSD